MKASRSTRAAELVKAGTHTQAEAAREMELPRSAVSKVLSRKAVTKKKDNTPPQPTIKPGDRRADRDDKAIRQQG